MYGVLPALAGSDEDGTRLVFKRVVALLGRQVQIEGRVGRRARGLSKEGRCRGSEGGGRGGLYGSKVERVCICKVGGRGRCGRCGVVQD